MTSPEDNADTEESAPDLQRRDLVMALVSLTQELGHLPNAEEINDFSKYTHQRYRDEFGDLFNAYEAAGILPDDITRQEFYGEEAAEPGTDVDDTKSEPEMLQEVDEADSVLGKPNGADEADAFLDDAVDFDTLRGVVDRPSFDTLADVTESDLVNEIQRFADIINEPPTWDLVVAYGRYPLDEYQARFDSWDSALDAAGFDPGDMPDWSARSHTNVDILDGIRAVADEVGHAPTTTETGTYVEFSPGLASLRFGSWVEALETAGLDPSERPSGQLSQSGDSADSTDSDDWQSTAAEDTGNDTNQDPISSEIDDMLEDMRLPTDEDGPA